MREILFRGKIIEPCKYQGQWLEGFYAVENGKPFIAIPKENGLNGFYCDPETIGQYTGLTDKNGKKIFEGNIVRYVRVDIDGSEDTYIGAICFEPEKAGFAIKRDDYRAFFVNSWLIDIEVIGNIYDNPELMEVEK